MRSAVGIFGIVCGVVVIWTVGNYGYASVDDPAARWNIAFLFAVIAAGGLFGHAVSVRLWPYQLGLFGARRPGVRCCADDQPVQQPRSLGRP
jgi:hypothetical protein